MTRKSVRKAIAASLAGAIIGPAAAVYDHYVGDFGGSQLPAVTVTSMGMGVQGLTSRGGRLGYRFAIQAFVPRGEATGTYTEQDADDALDDVTQAIAAWLVTNRASQGNWTALETEGDGIIQPVTLGGLKLWLETIPIRAYE